MYRRLSRWGQGAQVPWGPQSPWFGTEKPAALGCHLLREAESVSPPLPLGEGTRSDPLARLEAVLFLTREPLGTRKLAQLAGLADGTEARTLVRILNRLYDEEGFAFRALEVAGGFQLRSRAKFSPWLRRLNGAQAETRLSSPAMETLAVVAYRQPVLRAQIEAVRGVQCGEILRQLMERDLVRIVGRSEELGRPFLYGTTRQFLQVFGLRHLDELPRPYWFQPAPADESAGLSGDDIQQDLSSQTVASITTGGDPDVKITWETTVATEDDIRATAVLEPELEACCQPCIAAADEDEDDVEDDDEEWDDEEDEDEDLEDDEWEEVDDEDLDDEDLEDEEEEWDEDEEDEDWDDEDDEEWDDEEEEEEDDE